MTGPGLRHWERTPSNPLRLSRVISPAKEFPDARIHDRRPNPAANIRPDARRRVRTWLEQRWRYGFAEWFCNVD